MTKEAIVNAAHAQPFKPFYLKLTDGKLLHVPHPDFIHFTQGGRTAIVNGQGEHFSIVDVALVTTLEFDPPASISRE